MPTRRFLFATVLVAVMGASTFTLTCYAVLASDLIDAFGVARWQVGTLVTAVALMGAALSRPAGSFVDRLGARRSIIATILLATVGLCGLAVSPAYWAIVAVGILSGVAQSMGNPATNKLIAVHVASGRRAVITGVKQSGVTLWTFLGGLVLPLVAGAAGWRWAVASFAAVALMGAGLSTMLPADPFDAGRADVAARRAPVAPFIRRVALYGFVLGAAGSTIFTFLPLYAEEALGFGKEAAALTVSVVGVSGVVGRIVWGRIAEARLGTARALQVLAVASCGAALLLLAAGAVWWLLWVAAVVTGLSASSWNAVGMLAAMEHSTAAQTGRASGVVLTGFLAGLGLGAPVFGYSIDRLGSYRPGWVVVAVLFLVGVAIARDRGAGGAVGRV